MTAPGRLFYLIGASGSGKDALLAGCRQQLPAHARCCVAHRYITRAADVGGENHVHLSAAEFHLREQLGLFAMTWYSHGYHYAIGREIDHWLAAGLNVLVNGSRAYLPRAREQYPGLLPVLIEVAPERLRQRLIARGRESADEIECRLARHARLVAQLPADTLRIDNNGPLQQAVDALLERVMAHTDPARQAAPGHDHH